MSAVADMLARPLCAFAFCWRLERRDGITLGLTSHDRPLEVDGLAYRPVPSITPSALQQSGEGAADLMDIGGGLSSAAISEADLDAGRWDGAAVALHLTEWTAPGALWIELVRGRLGGIERQGSAYSATLQGAATLLDRPVAPVTSPTCRARLGDRACRVDMRQHARIGTIESAEGEALVFSGLTPGLYPMGSVRWLGGANCGLTQAILDQDGNTLFLDEPPPFAVAPGTRAMLAEGCDKRLATCAARFGNAANFRGEPFLPGMDLLTRYPGA